LTIVLSVRRLLIALGLSVALVLGALDPASFAGFQGFAGITEASAQTAKKKKRRSLFNILFGKRKAKSKAKNKRVKRKTSRKKSKRKSKKRRKAKTALSRAPKVVAVEKIENAKTVMVIGDFFAASLADGLEKSLVDNALVTVLDKSSGSSGFVRSDIVDWPNEVTKLVEEFKPNYIVAMLGSNDRQLLVSEGKRLKKRTPEWDEAYQKRLAALGASLKATRIPFTWVGLPPVRFSSMNKDFLVFNEWYQKAAADAGGKFVDVWDGFSDAKGAYSRSGPDVNGQIVLLRGKDGLNMTKAGRRRLAFYVEGTVRKRLGDSSGLIATTLDGLEDLSLSEPQAPSYDPAKSGITVVVSLDDPKVDGASELAGGEAPTPAVKVDATTVPVEVTPVLKTGRADNYTWPPVNGTIPSATGALATTN